MLKNFLWQREDEPQNAMSYIFIGVNLFYGICFTFFGFSEIVQGSAIAASALPTITWGLATLSLFILTMYSIATRNRRIGTTIGFVGFIIWLYGLILNAVFGMWFGSVVIYLPQLFFWIFWYIGVNRFYAREDLAHESFERKKNG